MSTVTEFTAARAARAALTEHEPEPQATRGRELVYLSGTDLAKPLPPLAYLVPHLGIATGAPVLVAGYGFSGKTLALQSLALSVASGTPLWGVYSTRRGAVTHLDWEQGARLTSERYQRLALGMGLDLKDLPLRVCVQPCASLGDRDAETVYEKACEGQALVIVDSLRAADSKADENSSEVRRSLDLLNRVAEKHGTVVFVIHHANKPKADAPEGNRYRIRGSSAIFDGAASVFVFASEKGQPIRVTHEKCRNRGTTVEDFGLRVADVDVPAGRALVVAHLEAEQLASSEGKAARGPAMGKARILDFLHGQTRREFRGSKSAMLPHLGMGRDAFFASFSELESTGALETGRDATGAYVRCGPEQSGTVPGPDQTDHDSPVRNGPTPRGPDQTRPLDADAGEDAEGQSVRQSDTLGGQTRPDREARR